MKVFSWVHRCFLQAHAHSGTAFIQDYEEVEKEVTGETHCLAHHVEDWKLKDGILAIGTLAVGPLDTATCSVNEEEQVVVEDSVGIGVIDDCDQVDIPIFNGCKEIQEIADDDINGSCDHIVRRRARLTLADLFSEDSGDPLPKDGNIIVDTDTQDQVDHAANNIRLVANTTKKIKPSNLSKAKALLKDEFRPLNKLNQMMKRMLKNKIHPDFEGKVQKKDIQMQPSNALGIPPTTKKETKSYIFFASHSRVRFDGLSS